MTARIVIIDDMELNIVMLEAMVRRQHDGEIVTFTDPQAALDWCAADQPTLILVDHLMPGMDGVTFLHRLRRIDHCQSVPTLVITADQDRATLLSALEAGANDFIRKPVDGIEFQARVSNALQFGTALADLRRLATTDALTGLLNRRAFMKRLEDEHDRAMRYDQPFSVAILDVDHFKTVNDRFGHATGDRALIAVADACRDVLRKPDVIGRLGGEEFGLILPATIRADAHIAAERVRAALPLIPFASLGGEGVLTASLGIAEFAPGLAAAELLNSADKALYAAKSNGRNQVAFAA